MISAAQYDNNIDLFPERFRKIIFFTGAGMSAESGIPTYRGEGGVWHQYRWDEYACQEAFEHHPEKVLEFHRIRREKIGECEPHEGHLVIARLEKKYWRLQNIQVITQNIDGLHQRAGTKNVTELHGSIWKYRCDPCQKLFSIQQGESGIDKCPLCKKWVRPHIVWFGDYLDPDILYRVGNEIRRCDLFISVGTSGTVWPAAGFHKLASQSGALCIEINPEETENSGYFRHTFRERAGSSLSKLFGKYI